jgi:hypothetical protein
MKWAVFVLRFAVGAPLAIGGGGMIFFLCVGHLFNYLATCFNAFRDGFPNAGKVWLEILNASSTTITPMIWSIFVWALVMGIGVAVLPKDWPRD